MTINVDSDACTGYGTYAMVCPMGIINTASDETLPRVPEEKAGMCISGGHCEAFCPAGALEQGNRTHRDRMPALMPGTFIPDQLGTYIKSRRSIRQYCSELVDREIISSILDVARYAATGGNGQPVRWLVIHDLREVATIAGLTIDWMKELAESSHPISAYAPHLIAAWDRGIDVICRGAPHLLIPTYRRRTRLR
jgi:Fe-S-cluster-containing hydrogenase component 2